MADAIYTALTGAVAQQQALDSAAHNLANVSTAGFRGDKLVFAEMVRREQARGTGSTAAASGAAPQLSKFVRVAQTAIDTEDGLIKQTGNPLDLALRGDAYFVVRTAQGDRLSRAGNFMLDAQRRIATPDGALVLSEAGNPIQLPPGATDIVVTQKGVVQLNGQDIATLQLKSVADPASLSREGNTTYQPSAGTPLLDATDVEVVQGYLESSNVNAFEGIEQLGDINASFSALMKVIESLNQIDSRTARELGSRTA